MMGASKYIPSTWVSFQVVIRLFSRSIWDTWSSSICQRKSAQGESQCGVGYGLRTHGQDGGMQVEAEVGSMGGYEGRWTEPAWKGLTRPLQGAYVEDADIVVNEVFHHLDLMLPFAIGLEEAGCEEQ